MMMSGDDPPYLTIGTDVSAKYKGAFCEAKIRKVVKTVKCKVNFKQGFGSYTIADDHIKGTIRVGAHVEGKHPDKNQYLEAVIGKIQDCSQYTVVFDDGDITTLRRTALCLKSGRHFAESETLDQLPLTNPEHFSTPVISGRRVGRRSRQHLDDSSDDDESIASSTSRSPSKIREKEDDVGKVVCVDFGDKKKSKDNWFPGLVVAPTAQDAVKIKVKEDYCVRSFKDGRYYTVPKKEATEFTKQQCSKLDNTNLKIAVEKALLFLDKDELPPHWDRDLLFGLDMSSEEERGDDSDTDSLDDEPREEKDFFVAQLYKFMDDRGTPINTGPTVAGKDLDLYRLFKVVHKMGGHNRVTNHNEWKIVYNKMGMQERNSGAGHGALHIRQAYKKYLSNFEDFYRKLGCTMVSHPRSSRKRNQSGRSLIRGPDRGPATPSPLAKPGSTKKYKDDSSSKCDSDSQDEIVAPNKKERNGTPTRTQSETQKKVDPEEKKETRAMKEEKTTKKERKMPTRREDKDGAKLTKSEPARKGVKRDVEDKSKKDEKGNTSKIVKKEEKTNAKKEDKANANKTLSDKATSRSVQALNFKREISTRRDDKGLSEKRSATTMAARKKEERVKKEEEKTKEDKDDKAKKEESKKETEKAKDEKPKKETKKDELKKATVAVKKEEKGSESKKEESSVDVKKEEKTVTTRKEAKNKEEEDRSAKKEAEEKRSNIMTRKLLREDSRTSLRKEEIETPKRETKKKSEDEETITRSKAKEVKKEDEKKKTKEPEKKIIKTRKEETITKKTPPPPPPDEMMRKRTRKRDDQRPEMECVLPAKVDVVVGDTLKVFYGPSAKDSSVTYNAKVVDVEIRESGEEYFVHYQGWNTRYDEWIRRSRIAQNVSWTPTRAKRRSKGSIEGLQKTPPPPPVLRRSRSSSVTSIDFNRQIESKEKKGSERSTTPQTGTRMRNRTYSPSTPRTRSKSPAITTERKSPVSRSRSPVTRSRSPMSRSRSPVTRSKSPSARSKSPVTVRAKSPMTRSKSPVTRSKSPVTRRSKSPVTTRSKSPVAAARKSPTRTKSPPATRSKSPTINKSLSIRRTRSKSPAIVSNTRGGSPSSSPRGCSPLQAKPSTVATSETTLPNTRSKLPLNSKPIPTSQTSSNAVCITSELKESETKLETKPVIVDRAPSPEISAASSVEAIKELLASKDRSDSPTYCKSVVAVDKSLAPVTPHEMDTSVIKLEADSVIKSESDSVMKCESDSVIKSESDSVTKSESDSVTKSKSDSVTKSKFDSVTKSKSDSVTKSESDSVTKSESDSATKSESDAATKSESDAATKSESDAATKSESDAATKSESDAATRSESDAATRSESDAATRSESDSVTRSESDSVTRSESDSVIKSESDSTAKSDSTIKSESDSTKMSVVALLQTTITPDISCLAKRRSESPSDSKSSSPESPSSSGPLSLPRLRTLRSDSKSSSESRRRMRKASDATVSDGAQESCSDSDEDKLTIDEDPITEETKTEGEPLIKSQVPRGRNIDLNQIRSEMKGLDIRSLIITESPSPGDNVLEQYEQGKKMSSDLDDIYEFKEPEPLNLELPFKRDYDETGRRIMRKLASESPQKKPDMGKTTVVEAAVKNPDVGSAQKALVQDASSITPIVTESPSKKTTDNISCSTSVKRVETSGKRNLATPILSQAAGKKAVSVNEIDIPIKVDIQSAGFSTEPSKNVPVMQLPLSKSTFPNFSKQEDRGKSKSEELFDKFCSFGSQSLEALNAATDKESVPIVIPKIEKKEPKSVAETIEKFPKRSANAEVSDKPVSVKPDIGSSFSAAKKSESEKKPTSNLFSKYGESKFIPFSCRKQEVFPNLSMKALGATPKPDEKKNDKESGYSITAVPIKAEVISKEESPVVKKIDTFKKMDKIDSFKKIEKIEPFKKIEKVDSFKKTEKIELFKKGEKLESFKKIEKTDSFKKTEKMEPFKKIDPPKSLANHELEKDGPLPKNVARTESKTEPHPTIKKKDDDDEEDLIGVAIQRVLDMKKAEGKIKEEEEHVSGESNKRETKRRRAKIVSRQYVSDEDTESDDDRHPRRKLQERLRRKRVLRGKTAKTEEVPPPPPPASSEETVIARHAVSDSDDTSNGFMPKRNRITGKHFPDEDHKELLCDEVLPHSPGATDLPANVILPSTSGDCKSASLIDNTPPTTPESSLSGDSPTSVVDSTYPDDKLEGVRGGKGHRKRSSPSESSVKRKRRSSGGSMKVKKRRPNTDDTDDTNDSSMSSYVQQLSQRNRTSKYNFYVELDPELDGTQRINVIQSKLAELRKTYMELKAEVASIDRRRKKQKKKEAGMLVSLHNQKL